MGQGVGGKAQPPGIRQQGPFPAGNQNRQESVPGQFLQKHPDHLLGPPRPATGDRQEDLIHRPFPPGHREWPGP